MKLSTFCTQNQSLSRYLPASLLVLSVIGVLIWVCEQVLGMGLHIHMAHALLGRVLIP